MYLFFFLIALLTTASADQPYTDQQAHLAQLLAQLAQMQSIVKDLERLNLALEQNTRIVNEEQSKRRLRIAALDDAHQLTLDLWEQLFVNNHHKTWNCPSIQKQHFQSLENQIHLLNTTAQQNIITIHSQKYCLRNKRMIHGNSFVSRTMKGLELEIVSTCLQSQHQLTGVAFLDTSQTKYYPNLNTQSAWTYGNLTIKQYQTKINELTHIFNAIPCPIENPFLNKDNNCIRCQKDGEVYDVSMKLCIICEGECIIGGGRFNSNQKGQNYIGNRIQLPLASNCPEHSPFYNGYRCISCNLPLYFSLNSLKCQACPEETGFDLKSKQCISNIFFVSYSGQIENYIGGPFSPPPFATIKQCNQSQPYSNGKVCTSCTLPNFYNYHTGNCQSCPAGLIFNASRHSCGGGPGAKINSNLMGSRNFMGQVPVFQRIYGVCPLQARFFNGTQCIDCQLPHFFNFSSYKCEICPTKQVFDSSFQACVAQAQSYVTNLNNPNIYYNGNFDVIVSAINKSKSKGAKQCMLFQPFYDPKTDKCKACPPDTPQFDIRRGNCFACGGGSRFERKSRICLSTQVSPSIERMIMNGFL